MVLKAEAASHMYLMEDHPSFVCPLGASLRLLTFLYAADLSPFLWWLKANSTLSDFSLP